jgi:hypothetical protein
MTRILFSILTMFLISCASSEPKVDAEKYEKAKESVGEQEKKDPVQFLTVSSTDRKNLIGQKVVKGTVTNKASVASYKDIIVKVGFYSKTGVLLEEVKETVYEVVAPNHSASFKTKNFAPKGTDEVKVSIVSAKVAE